MSFFFFSQKVEAEFGLAFVVPDHADRESSAQIIVNKRGFIAGFACVPGINPQRCEIAGLALRPARAGSEVLRVIAFAIGDAIEFEPGERANVGRLSAFTHRVRQVERDKSPYNPAGDGDGLVSWLRGIGDGRIADYAFTRRTRGDTPDEEPVLFFCFGRLPSFFFVGNLDPIGGGSADDFNRRVAGELVQARLIAAGFDTQVSGNFCTPTPLNRDGRGQLDQLGTALPEFRLHQIVAVHPSNDAGSRANFHIFVAARQYIHVIAIEQHANLFADLGDAAPKRDAALADVGVADGFVLGTKNPGKQRHNAEQRHRDKQLPLHAESPKVAPTDRAA